MTANVTSNSRTKFYIGGHASTDAYLVVNGLTDLDGFGDKSEVISEKIIGEGRVRRTRGTRDAGSFSVTVALDDADAGQDKLRDAEADDAGVYFFKFEFEGMKARILKGFVSAYEEMPGGADANVKAKFTIELVEKPVQAP